MARAAAGLFAGPVASRLRCQIPASADRARQARQLISHLTKGLSRKKVTAPAAFLAVRAGNRSRASGRLARGSHPDQNGNQPMTRYGSAFGSFWRIRHLFAVGLGLLAGVPSLSLAQSA